MRPTPEHVTQVINAAAAGEKAATDELLPLVYEELRRLAHQRIRSEAGGGAGLTLQPTALVHEAYLRLLGEDQVQWSNRGHFFGAAAHAMRRILIERARKRHSVKHGADRKRLTLDETEIAVDGHADELLQLEPALAALEQRDPRKAQIVMLRFFAGLSVEQTAMAMELSPRTVKSEWRFARAWLAGEMRQ
jgi:RNA polymerase sigma factor (TIGR02999 family)